MINWTRVKLSWISFLSVARNEVKFNNLSHRHSLNSVTIYLFRWIPNASNSTYIRGHTIMPNKIHLSYVIPAWKHSYTCSIIGQSQSKPIKPITPVGTYLPEIKSHFDSAANRVSNANRYHYARTIPISIRNHSAQPWSTALRAVQRFLISIEFPALSFRENAIQGPASLWAFRLNGWRVECFWMQACGQRKSRGWSVGL